MIACKFSQLLSRKLFLSRAISTSSVYCKDDTKVPPVPPFPPVLESKEQKEKVPIAPKVIAKNPPIEELTRGRIFDPKTQTYRVAKVPYQTEIKTEVPEQAPAKEVIDPGKEALRRHIILAFTAKLKHAALQAQATDATPTVGAATPGVPPPPVPRLIRQEPERTMFCLIPYPWVKAFNNKTGVTGFWTFLFTYTTYLMSKEKIIMEHEYYGGLSMIVLGYLAVKYVGPGIAQGLDKEIDAFEAGYQQQRINEKKSIDDNIQHEQQLQVSMEEQLVLVQAKRENVDLQLEAEYRERQMEAYRKVKSMLDFQVAYEEIERRYAQRQMVDWTIEKVHASVTDELDSSYVDNRLEELDVLLKERKAI